MPVKPAIDPRSVPNIDLSVHVPGSTGLPVHQPLSASQPASPVLLLQGRPDLFLANSVGASLSQPLRASNSSSCSTVNVVRGQTRTPTPQHPPLGSDFCQQLASGILPFILPPDAVPSLSFPISLIQSALIASLSGFDTWVEAT
ncbi:Cutinase transcription factor 1 beta [Fusarium oxysporum f. sp. albedinis]|nr:Cutinase transcription factor 1 beta [Fusarium oxysporum f. sp. albedinis]